MQNNTQAVIETKFAAIEDPQKKPVEESFPNIYSDDNYIPSNNFRQQYIDHFATAGANNANRILFAPLFSKIVSVFAGKSKSEN